jgi:putative glycosyltransferase (TIGR04372 family)
MRCATIVLAIFHFLRAHRAIRAADNIVLRPAGGFAFSLIIPDWVRRLFPNETNLTLFGHWAGRHNMAVPQIWDGGLIFVPQSVRVPGLGVVADELWTRSVFRAMAGVMRLIWPHKRILMREELILASPRPDFVPPDSFFSKRNECYYYNLVVTRPMASPHLPSAVTWQIETAIAARCPTNLGKSCNLYLRDKGDGIAEDMSSFRRIAAPIDTYLPSVRHLIANGYRVFLTGNREIPDALREEFGSSFVDWRSVGVTRDLYHLYVGLGSDIHIGSLSGGSAYVHVADIPALIVDAFPFGDGLPFSTVHYKYLRGRDGRLVPPERLLSEFFFDHDCHGYDIVDNTAEEILAAVQDWLPHAAPRQPYGLDSAEFRVDAPWLRTANARLSPVWLRRFREAEYAPVADKARQSKRVS